MNLSFHDHRRRPRMTRRVLRGFSSTAFATALENSGRGVPSLARRANIGTATIHGWKRGEATPTIGLLARVMNELNLPIETVVIVPINERFPGDWRNLRGMEQVELAKAANIATTTLGGIERGDIALTDTNATNLAKLLQLSVEEYRAAYTRARERDDDTPV